MRSLSQRRRGHPAPRGPAPSPPAAGHRRLWWGGAAVVAYLAVALASFGSGLVSVRPLYDGMTGELYRWVNPPEPLAQGNRKPLSFRDAFQLTAGGSPTYTAATLDRQITVTFPENLVRARPGERAVRVEIEPVDPRTAGPPPTGAGYDGNAYRVSATYAGSGERVDLAADCPPGTQPEGAPRCLAVVVHYALGPVLMRGTTSLYRHSPAGWQGLPAKDLAEARHVFGASPKLGLFVAAGPNRPKGSAGGGTSRLPLALALAGAAALAGIVLIRPRRKERP